MVVNEYLPPLDLFSAEHGQVVDQGTKDYAIVITLNPEPEFVCYGVRNKQTRVDEYLSSSLAKARFILQELQKDLDAGFDRRVDDLLPGMFGTKPKEPTNGGSNRAN